MKRLTIVYNMEVKIPKILHQMWIGEKKPPKAWMQTWKDKNPDYQYILWDETRLKILEEFPLHEQIAVMPEIIGRVDIYRWYILYIYGGYFFDADSVCIEPLADHFAGLTAFSCFEHESIRPGLIAIGAMGFMPRHPVIKFILEMIQNPEYNTTLTQLPAWRSVGPLMLTRAIHSCADSPVGIYPSYSFLPKHHTGALYNGHGKIYAFQYWCSSSQWYDLELQEIEDMNKELLDIFRPPEEWVSVVIPCHNTETEYMVDCLMSLRDQKGSMGIQLIWINDGSTSENTAAQLHLLDRLRETTRNMEIVYLENTLQQGCRNSLRRAVQHCSHELIMKMDADDIMVPNRLQMQMQFMKEHPDLALSGGQMSFLKNGKTTGMTNHPLEMTWEEFQETKHAWFMNHPTFCFRREALLQVDNYPTQALPLNSPVENMMDDYEVILRILRSFRVVRNMPEVLLMYRVHENQMTQKWRGSEVDDYRSRIIHKYVSEE